MSGTILHSVAFILNGLQKSSFNSANMINLEKQFSFLFPSVRKKTWSTSLLGMLICTNLSKNCH